MACNGGPTAEQEEQAALTRARKLQEDKDLRASVVTLRAAEKKLGILLCEACQLLDDRKLMKLGSRGLQAWHAAHRAEDEKEKVAAGALAKLSKKEREALGLSHGKKK